MATRTGNNDDEEAFIGALLSIDPEIKEWRQCFAEAMLSDSVSLPATCVRLAEQSLIEAPRSHQRFLALLDDEDARVREAGALLIYLMEPSLPDVHKALLPLLGDPLPRVRWTAAAAFSKSDGPLREYLPKLEELARDDEHPLVRIAAATSIRKLGIVGNAETMGTIILDGLRLITFPPELQFGRTETGADSRRLFVKSSLEVLGDMRDQGRDALPLLLMLYDEDVYDRRFLGQIIHKIDETIVLRYF